MVRSSSGQPTPFPEPQGVPPAISGTTHREINYFLRFRLRGLLFWFFHRFGVGRGEHRFRSELAAFQIGEHRPHLIGRHGVRFDSPRAGDVNAHHFAGKIHERPAAFARLQHRVVFDDGGEAAIDFAQFAPHRVHAVAAARLRRPERGDDRQFLVIPTHNERDFVTGIMLPHDLNHLFRRRNGLIVDLCYQITHTKAGSYGGCKWPNFSDRHTVFPLTWSDSQHRFWHFRPCGNHSPWYAHHTDRLGQLARRSGSHELTDHRAFVVVGPVDRFQIFRVDLEHRQVVVRIEPDHFGRKLLSIAQAADNRIVQFAVLGGDPAIGADHGAQFGFLAVAIHSHGAFVGLGNHRLKRGQHLRAVALVPPVGQAASLGHCRRGTDDCQHKNCNDPLEC